MTKDEFFELRYWLKDQWPALDALRSGQWLAYFDALAPFDPSDVWAAAQNYRAAGHDFPPVVSHLAAAAAEEARHHAARNALPAPQGISWDEYCQQRWGRHVPLSDLPRLLVEGALK